ncbi:thermonuclease family protein [Macrococcus equipercicus]|uniref:Thermonuclease n=1 Tax=Macrococcus equipercicus TaxID=69967 RepID=A0A9Q9BQH1_9STAP|nr:thermonuclease family protein [Macrococcus equipercicus]UTH13609.1 thermonuclease family protein [Macrococcus equipercicus]
MTLYMKALLLTLTCLLMLTTTAEAKRIPVTFDRAIDGDTLSIKQHGRKKTIRLLLVDTPESKKPNTPVQPYSLEAAKYTESLVSTCPLSIEYDTKGRYDRYKRELVYLYCGDTMVNEQLVRKGYARVGYIYQQKDHLKELEDAQRYAKQHQLNIWSMDGYVNEDGEGFNTTQEDRDKETDFVEQLRQALYRIVDAALDTLIKELMSNF